MFFELTLSSYHLHLQFHFKDNFVISDPTRKKRKYYMFDMQIHYTCYFIL